MIHLCSVYMGLRSLEHHLSEPWTCHKEEAMRFRNEGTLAGVSGSSGFTVTDRHTARITCYWGHWDFLSQFFRKLPSAFLSWVSFVENPMESPPSPNHMQPSALEPEAGRFKTKPAGLLETSGTCFQCGCVAGPLGGCDGCWYATCGTVAMSFLKKVILLLFLDKASYQGNTVTLGLPVKPTPDETCT